MVQPLVLIILDGWGLAQNGQGNAITLSKLITIPHLWKTFPHTMLSACGKDVGLPDNEKGNTEIGHLNIGAGRIIYFDLARINNAITDGTFQKNDAFIGAIRHAQIHSSNVHLVGLLSDVCVHSSRDHLYALIHLLDNKHVKSAFIHLFTDGRDSPPQSALSFLQHFTDNCVTRQNYPIATIIGRYYAMDRDMRWERTEKAYNALTIGTPVTAQTPQEAIRIAYNKKQSDEFIEPISIVDRTGTVYPRISDNDSVIFFNFRVDRPRQLTRALVLHDFESNRVFAAYDPYAEKYYHTHIPIIRRPKPFQRRKICSNLFFVTMTEYEKNLPVIPAFPPQKVKMPIGKVLSIAGRRQLHIAETEKERFITYYFNGLRDDSYIGEDRCIIPSPMVPTYDLAPAMSAHDLTNRFIDRLKLNLYSFIVINFANADMVGHTGNITATITACETVDTCVGLIVKEVLKRNGTCVITADHGNAEEMLTGSGTIDTEHSSSPVPFIFVNKQFEGKHEVLPNGILADIAPTILRFLKLPVPEEMTGKNLLSDMHV